jgi:hypothetical protein
LGEQEASAHRRQVDRQLVVGRAVKAYRDGDPLQRIAADAGMRSYEMLRLLSTRVSDRSEQQRFQSLRQRCAATTEVLRACEERIHQLLSAGIDSSDVPKVLVALGATMNIDIAVELLKSADILKDPDRGPTPFFVTDMMWLRYVTGYHRGIEPDYQLALGKIPLPNIQEFRMILAEQISRMQIAQVIALIETTAEAIRSGDDAGISYSEYEKAREAIILKSGDERRPLLPPPAELIRDRAAGRSWHVALESVGMRFPSVQGGFSVADYVDASRAYGATQCRFGSPKDVASYDSWMIAEIAMGRDRPSVVAIRRHFGTWESVIGAVMPPEVEDEFDGIVNHYRIQNSLEERWARAGELVGDVLAIMPWNSFLSIDYGDETDGPHRPYAQASPSADGVWCEIVSGEFLPADQWPISAEYLEGNGWSAPDDEVPNWHKQGIPPVEAGHQILEGLRYGRRCEDATKVRWHSADFPGGPGPDGGVILDDSPSGVVQTLRNAS